MNIGISVKIMFKEKCADCGHPRKFHMEDIIDTELDIEGEMGKAVTKWEIVGKVATGLPNSGRCMIHILDHMGAHNGVPYGKSYRCTCLKFQDGD